MLCHFATSVFPLNVVNVGIFVDVVASTIADKSIGYFCDDEGGD